MVVPPKHQRAAIRNPEVTKSDLLLFLYLQDAPSARKVVLLYRAEVRVELKPGVADPEGANTKKALELLGFSGLGAVKSVHAFSLEVDAANEGDARKQVEEMCKRLLVNPVIHHADIRVEKA